jgi:cathepsin H
VEAHTCIQAKAAAASHKKDDFDCTSWTGLAEQQLVDCAGDYNNNGCSGGLPSQAFEYIKYAGGIDLEPSYPYQGNETGTCTACCGDVGAKVAEVFNITTRDEDDLEYAIGAIGPVSIAYQVASDFRHYAHGVYDSYNVTTNTTNCKSSPQDVNHAVVAVGLGITEATEDAPAQPYYIVRNSWGTSWGMEGYFWMLRGKNLCGVSDCASFPLVPSWSEGKTHLEHAKESASAIL